ncbi:MAG: hypothetical protein MPJ22_00690 [Pirellulales bacterium]|nr:hypothetical protein [Pirellulales bacterium]
MRHDEQARIITDVIVPGPALAELDGGPIRDTDHVRRVIGLPDKDGIWLILDHAGDRVFITDPDDRLDFEAWFSRTHHCRWELAGHVRAAHGPVYKQAPWHESCSIFAHTSNRPKQEPGGRGRITDHHDGGRQRLFCENVMVQPRDGPVAARPAKPRMLKVGPVRSPAAAAGAPWAGPQVRPPTGIRPIRRSRSWRPPRKPRRQSD